MASTSDISSKSDEGRPVLTIYGPTASGKSAFALAAAARYDGVVINADSMQVYRGLRILTARPTEADEAAAPHRLYGWLEPDDPCSAGRWRTAALAEIDAAHNAGKLPIVCGGTGFYLQALEQGLPAAPEISVDVRAAAREEATADPAALHAKLAAADPATAARILPTDAQRLARVLEIWRETGDLPSVVLDRPPEPPTGLRFHSVALAPPRAELYARINARVVDMVDAGALAEAAAFAARNIDPTLPAARAVGLQAFIAAAKNEILFQEAIFATAQASRRYAKRQMTWLRHRCDPQIYIETQLNAELLNYYVLKLEELRLTPLESPTKLPKS